MNNTLLAKELNNKQSIASGVKSFWADYFNLEKDINIIPMRFVDYPFWEEKGQQQLETNIYRAVVTDIDNSYVTVSIENVNDYQAECYILERKLFDFSVKVEDIVELVVENMPGQSCIKTRKYIKNQYYKDKEDNIISKILKNIDEEDDF